MVSKTQVLGSQLAAKTHQIQSPSEDYVPQTNFDFKFVKKILPLTQLSDYSGFVVEVTHATGANCNPRKG